MRARRERDWVKYGGTMALRNVRTYLEWKSKQDEAGSMLEPNIYRLLAVTEAIAIIDHLLAGFERERMEGIKAMQREIIAKRTQAPVEWV